METSPSAQNSNILNPNPVPAYPKCLRGISVGGVFGYLLCTGDKSHEVRRRPTKFTGWAIVHVPTSSSWDFSFEEFNVAPAKCPKRSLIGAIYIKTCDHEPEQNIYGYGVSDWILFHEPITDPEGIKGKRQALWTPGPEPANIRAFNEAWKVVYDLIKDDEHVEEKYKLPSV